MTPFLSSSAGAFHEMVTVVGLLDVAMKLSGGPVGATVENHIVMIFLSFCGKQPLFHSPPSAVVKLITSVETEPYVLVLFIRK